MIPADGSLPLPCGSGVPRLGVRSLRARAEGPAAGGEGQRAPSSARYAPREPTPHVEFLPQFLDELNELEQQRPIVVIWDGLPPHQSERMRDWLASQRHWLRAEPLPSYANDLNPIKQVWGGRTFKEPRDQCLDALDQIAGVGEDRLGRIGSDVSVCFASLRHSGLQL